MIRAIVSVGRPIALAAALSMAVSPVLAQTQAGIAAAVRNKVEIRSAATRKAHPAALRERLYMADQVQTAAASQLQMLLMDRTTFTVGANARVTIDRFVYDPAANSRQVGISVAHGAFRFMSGRALGRPSGAVSVRTPVAAIGIRGTIFEGVVGEDAIRIAEDEPAVGKRVKADKGEASLIVLRGPGPRAQGDVVPGIIDVTVGDRTVTLDGPDLALYAPRDGAPPIGPFRISPAGLEALQDLLRTSPGSAPGSGGGNHTARNIAIGAGVVAAGIIGSKLLGGGGKKPKPGAPKNPNAQAPPPRKPNGG
ncbi:MAG TPA: FecR family protein [Allosphingosinicella sp.]